MRFRQVCIAVLHLIYGNGFIPVVAGVNMTHGKGMPQREFWGW